MSILLSTEIFNFTKRLIGKKIFNSKVKIIKALILHQELKEYNIKIIV